MFEIKKNSWCFLCWIRVDQEKELYKVLTIVILTFWSMRIIFVWVICVTNTGAPWMEIEISDWPEVVKVRIGQVLWPRPDRAFSITTWTAIRPSTFEPCKVIVYTAVAPGSNVVYQSTVVLNGIFLKLTILPLKVGTATVPPLTELASQLNKWFFWSKL